MRLDEDVAGLYWALIEPAERAYRLFVARIAWTVVPAPAAVRRQTDHTAATHTINTPSRWTTTNPT